MKKILLTCLAIYGLHAQISLKYDADVKGSFNADTSYNNNDTLFLNGDSDWNYDANLSSAFFEVANTGATSKSIKMKRTEVNVVANTKNNTCWVTCPINYLTAGDQVVYIGGSSANLNAGAADLTFVPKFKANGTQGTSTIRYTFYDEANLNDSIALVIVYNHETAASIEKLNINQFTTAPNPASDQVQISFHSEVNESVQLVVRNTNGQILYKEVQNIRFGQNTIHLETSEYPNGLYFISLEGKSGAFNSKLLID